MNHSLIRSRSLSRRSSAHRTIVLLLFTILVGAQIARAETDSCQSQCASPSAWVEESIFIALPQWPHCELEVRLRWRTCQQGTEVELFWIDWPAPESENDTNHPCYDLHMYVLGLPVDPRADFLRDLYNTALQSYTEFLFNRDYTMDSLLVVAYPNDPQFQQDLTERQCPNGQTIFRSTHAKCMIVLLRPFETTEGIRKEEGDDRSLASPLGKRMRARYEPCDVSVSYCCARVYTICRDTATHQNARTLTSTPSTQQSCPAEFDTTTIHPPMGRDEWVAAGCREYCLEGEEPPAQLRFRDSLNIGLLPRKEQR